MDQCTPPPPSPPCPPPWTTPPTPPPHLVTSQIRPIVRFLREPKRCPLSGAPPPPHFPNQTNCLVFGSPNGGTSAQHSQSPNGWNRCALRCFRTALKSFPETCQPQENPLGPATSTLCLKHLQCRQTSPPPFLGGRRHGVSP